MSTQSNTTDTTVKKVSVQDLDEIFNVGIADSVVTGENQDVKEPKAPNIFNRGGDLSFLDPGTDNEDEDVDVSRGTVEDEDESSSTQSGTEILDDLANDTPEDEEPAANTGRPKTDKSGLVTFFKKQIEAGRMEAFDDYDETKQTLDEYLGSLSQKDLDELWELNDSSLQVKVKEQVTTEFFESLPSELQYAAKYALDGGTDMKGLFRALAQVEETRELSLDKDTDQAEIMRQYLTATNFGEPDEIDAQITEWKDLGTLGNKAKQFKPKLDKMQEQLLESKIAEQERFKQQQQEAQQAYVGNIFNVLKAGELNGLKLDKTTQQALYTGLTQAGYKSLSGRNTNQLGHLLEKYQYGKDANYGLIAEALYLLSNPEGYRETLRKQGANVQNDKTVRQLKGEQQRRKSATTIEEKDEPISGKRQGLKRPVNIFKR